MTYIIATTNMKGGVGKTTLTVNLGASLAKDHGKRVLVVDLDTQISATLSLVSTQEFAKLRQENRTLKHLVNQIIQPINQTKINIHDVIKSYISNVKGFDLLPGDIDLYDEYLVSEMLHEKAIRLGKDKFDTVWNILESSLIFDILKPVFSDYDFIILDCAPGYNLITRSALVCSDFYLMPARPEPLSIIGIQLLERRLKQLKEIYKYTQPLQLELLGIAFTMSGNLMTGKYYKQVMQRVYEDFGQSKIFKTRIPMDFKVSKSVDSFLPVVFSDPTSSASKAFKKMTTELLEKVQIAVDMKQQKTKLNLVNLD
ncbi:MULTISPECIES: ParA family protein [Planktothricoides]|uniref:ParA family protein n=2 Tax=Planktothricoides raciborskii TaxID=132608 RepID=A0AAU8J719_9CYAN|nr:MULTISPECIES: ParA family protein [Planktothricoides]KOR38329.1 cobyrinic acid a,c-diamide synthase [Planktothricoides sp. SR001]MBD2543399.1 ParA family protein [Planktothricoides raciborskii FACHB-1370]MBD2581698.1 ParA family protein [Planktothricoides raciborskii FACHB-1261]